MSLSNPYYLICPHCGSTDVIADAAADFNPHTQQWELISVYDNRTCNTCGEDDIRPHTLALSRIPQTLPLLITNTQMALSNRPRAVSPLEKFLHHLYYEDHPHAPSQSEAVFLGVI